MGGKLAALLAEKGHGTNEASARSALPGHHRGPHIIASARLPRTIRQCVRVGNSRRDPRSHGKLDLLLERRSSERRYVRARLTVLGLGVAAAAAADTDAACE